MIAQLEKPAFLSLAVLIHIGLAARGIGVGGEAGGIGGEAFASVQASSLQIEQMVADWTKVPDVLQDAATLQDPPSVTENLMQPEIAFDPAPKAMVQMAAIVPMDLPQTPQIDTRPPEPPKPRAAEKNEAKPKPQQKPATKNQKSSAGRKEEKAAGSGGTPTAGNNGQSAGISKGQKSKLMSVWGSKIRSRIERKKRAPRGVKGTAVVHVAIKVAPNGELIASRITKSSGVAEFDQAAISAVRHAGRFAKAPAKLDKASYNFSFSLRFKR